MRRNLDIPDNISIKSVQFLEDCVVISMDSDKLNEYYNYFVNKYKEIRSAGMLAVGGFVSETLFLTDYVGNTCRVIFANVVGDHVVTHEREHITFFEYYERQKPSKIIVPEVNQRLETNKKFKQKLDEQKINDFYNVSDSARSYLRPILESCKLLYYEELICEFSYLFFIDKPNRAERMSSILNYVPDWFDLATVHTLWINHDYGESMSQIVNGMRDVITELPDLSPEEKLKLGWELELQAAKVSAEARTISNWMATLWKKTGGDIEEFITILEVIPYKYISSIGYFIDQDPKKLQQQLKRVDPEQRRLEEQSLWRMMLRHAEDNENIRQLPKIETYVQNLKNLMRNKSEQNQLIDTQKLFQYLQNEMITDYLAIDKDLIETLYREYSLFINQLASVGAPIHQYDWLMVSFIKTYLNKLLNFQAIQNAIKELLTEKGYDDHAIGIVIDEYERLLEAEDGKKKTGFGYRIIEEEGKIWENMRKGK
jgi:hypothetical protein